MFRRMSRIRIAAKFCCQKRGGLSHSLRIGCMLRERRKSLSEEGGQSHGTVGVDLHKRVSHPAALTARELMQHRLENELGPVERFFAQLPSPAHVAIEAAGTWWWLVVS